MANEIPTSLPPLTPEDDWFIVGDHEQLLQSTDRELLSDLRAEATEHNQGVLSPEDEAEIAVYGTELAVAEIRRKRADEALKKTDEHIKRSRELTAPFRETDAPEEPRAKAGKRKYGAKGAKRAHATKVRNRSHRASHKIGLEVAEHDEDAIENWGLLEVGGKTYEPEMHLLGDKRSGDCEIHLFDRQDKKRQDDIKITFKPFADGQQAQFLGLKVPEALRGQHLGKEIFTYFLDGLKKQGITFIGTAQINKPTIALLLQEVGLRPKHKDSIAVILPGESQDLPTVFFVKKPDAAKGLARLKSQSDNGRRFYNEVDSVPESIPHDQLKIVALHTRYLPR